MNYIFNVDCVCMYIRKVICISKEINIKPETAEKWSA